MRRRYPVDETKSDVREIAQDVRKQSLVGEVGGGQKPVIPCNRWLVKNQYLHGSPPVLAFVELF
jgi:hypothetical protein